MQLILNHKNYLKETFFSYSCYFSRVVMSHEEIARTDRVYLSAQLFPEPHHTKTSYYGTVS